MAQSSLNLAYCLIKLRGYAIQTFLTLLTSFVVVKMSSFRCWRTTRVFMLVFVNIHEADISFLYN